MSTTSNTLNLESNIVFQPLSDGLLDSLNYIDKMFFKGNFVHLTNIWSKITISECHDLHTRLYYWFLKIREAIYSKDLQNALTFLHDYSLDCKKTSDAIPGIDIAKIFDLELFDKDSLNEEILDFFCEQVMEVALQKAYPLESRIHYLIIGSTTFLDFGTNISHALQYSQLAVSLAEQLVDEKRYYLAWALACQAQVLWKIGHITEAIYHANHSLELFAQFGTGEFLGKFDAIKVLVSLADAQGRFASAITLVHIARTNTTKTNVLRSYFLEFDLYILRGSLESARKIIDELLHLDIPNLGHKWDTRFRLRELHLMMLEGFQSLVDRQIQVLLNQPNLDNENKIQCYMLLADNFAYMHEYEQALSTARCALELAEKNSNPDKLLDIYRLMIDLGLRRSIESESEYDLIETNDQWNLDNWFDEAYRIAFERNVNITLIELQLYSLLRQILKNDLDSQLKPIMLAIQKQCKEIKWIHGEKLVEKLLLFLDASTITHLLIDNPAHSNNKNMHISLEEVALYLKDLKASI